MSDNDGEEDEQKPYAVDHPKQGRASCKKCKEKCPAGELRIAKVVNSPYGEGKMKQWHHVPCLFEAFLNQRATTKRIDDVDEIEGWDTLSQEEKDDMLEKLNECEKKMAEKFGKNPPKKITAIKTVIQIPSTSNAKIATVTKFPTSKDNLFREFRRLVAEVTNESKYLEKTAIIKKTFTKGADGTGFKGDIIQWCRLLLPLVVKRIYNLQSKQLVKVFSKIFKTNQDDMLEHLERGDVGETIQNFFENSDVTHPAKKSLLMIQEVDDFLEELSRLTKEEEQMYHFKKILKKCTGNDLKLIIRLIKHDLRMNAGAKHVLEAVHPDAYDAFQSSRDIHSVLNRILGTSSEISSDTKSIKAAVSVMTPVLPMLAEACKSVEQAMKKCPNGMYSEIKYDGERVQVHKHGNDFKYYSRSLKPVMHHKVNHFKEYIPLAFPHAKDLILDSEVLMIDATNGKPLPFGSLGAHKKAEFKNANVCLFVFDCIYYNGEILTHKPIQERRRILKENMTEIKNHVMFSEVQEVHQAEDLSKMITKVLKLGLEGLVLKDLMSIYEPGKRHWLKVKKDYLCDGAMADTADLIVLGAWFGTGKKGGMMSVFLMGCFDEYTQKFYTVTKVHTGHDDKTLERLQKELDMIKISGEVSKVPTWLKCTRTMVPDFVAKDPKNQPVWEITGAEFTQHEVHTAEGISIRFPRVTKIRDDKTWEEATSLQELKNLFKTSKENADFELPQTNIDVKKEEDASVKKTKYIQRQLDRFEGSRKFKTEDDIKKEVETELAKRDFDDLDDEKPLKKLKTEPLKIKSNSDLFPNIFMNVKVLLAEELMREKFDDVLRHFIAVGGDLVETDDWREATHVIHVENTISDVPDNCPLSARHVVLDWIKDSIANAQMQDTRAYSVHWDPK